MKKLLLILGMITCMLGLTACAKNVESAVDYGITDEMAQQYAEGLINSINEIVLTGQEAQYKSDAVIFGALENYKKALPDMGDYQSVLETTVTYNKDIIINTVIQGSLRQAKVEIMLDGEELIPISVSTNVIYSFGEMMTKAALNTIMGMGTVFVVLIIIIVLISSFTLINKAQNKEDVKKEVVKPAPAPTAVPVEESEDLSDDLELVAVIAAAIAAYEGKTSADGYVVRSLRKR